MKSRIFWFSVLLLLNLVDAEITHNMLINDRYVAEANPLMDVIIQAFGYQGMFAYKVFGVVIISLVLSVMFNKAAWTRIMICVCSVFAVLMLYMLILLLCG